MAPPVKIINYFRERNRGLVLTLFIVTGLIYLPFLGNQLFFDDRPFFSEGMVNHFAYSSFQLDPRWFSYMSLAWTWLHFSDIPPIHRLFNFFLHVACVLLLFFWLQQLTIHVIPEIRASRTKSNYLNWGAWLGALFFACNPVSVYATGYIVQRSILLATLFTLAMQLAYLRGLVCTKKINQKLWLGLSIIFYFLAVFSKEHSLMAPAILIATTFLLRPNIPANKRALWITWFGYLAIGMLVVLRIKGVLGGVYEVDAPELFEQLDMSRLSTATLHILSLLTQADLFFKYLFLWLLPNPQWMSIDMREVFANSWDWRNWLGAIGFILYGASAGKLLMRRGWPGLAGLALLYPWLFFIVEFSVIRVQEPFVLYRSYMWVPGLMLFFPILINTLSNRKIAVITLTVITLSLVPLSWNRLWVFADNYRLWNDAALLLSDEHTPGAARIYYNRGIAELEAKRWNEAIKDFHRVNSINPEIAQSHNSLGTAYAGIGKHQEAIHEFDRAISLKHNYANAYYGKGLVLMRMHLNKEAMATMEKSCELKNGMACFLVAFSKSGK